MPLEPQDPCPSCREPMDGVGWTVEPHDCEFADALFCPHPEHWIGARPFCTEHGEPCQTPRAPFMQCVLGMGHVTRFHLTAGGTQFTNSGKVGLGEIGDDFRPTFTNQPPEFRR